jgi:hypothetical protein
MPFRYLLTVLLMALVASQAVAQDKGKKNKGNNKGNKDGKDDVVVYKFEMFKGKEKIGVVTPKDDDESSFQVTGYPELNGKATIHKVRQRPGIVKGVLVRPNGDKWDLEIEIKDR